MDGYSLMMRQRGRRLTALLASLLVTQLTTTASGFACPIHARDNPQRETAAAAHTMSHGGAATEHPATRVPTGDDMGMGGHCDFTCAPAACGSAVTCSATIAVTTESGLFPVSLATNTVVALAALTPQSLTTAPEPPPPRV
jgi:hypothetical protein